MITKRALRSIGEALGFRLAGDIDEDDEGISIAGLEEAQREIGKMQSALSSGGTVLVLSASEASALRLVAAEWFEQDPDRVKQWFQGGPKNAAAWRAWRKLNNQVKDK